ncbi:transposase [Yoonia sp. I 8.24]|uniref:REP-associated tyrosine transposase n=1 Tax=Yoonia sp. I 8.24 TaxID=1537229 RepID=UPI001EE07C4C|nr:transposase [Yoonia sp. I 8.24]MCG3267040.1 transposase [Yoonia sp. I 8.24]
MSSYRRRYVPGGTYFFSVQLRDAGSTLLVDRIDLLRSVTSLCMQRWPFEINAAVILPNKLHMIWTLPPDDADYSKRWRLIKSTFSRHCPAPAKQPQSKLCPGEKGIWQRRFWEHVIRDQTDYDLHDHLIITAPVTAGLVDKPSDWPYASICKRRVDLDPRGARTIAPVQSSLNPKAVVMTS